jgi:iduronate 2-sulfatase
LLPRDRAAQKRARGRPFASRDVADNALADGKIADRAIERLGALKAGDKPFFLAVGFNKPHLPFVAPKKYWEMYDPAKLPVGQPAALPEGAPAFVGNNSGELRQYASVPDRGPIPADMARSLVHGYYACVSYTDAQVGRVLDELDRAGLRDSTIVILWGDHGFQLGDHGLFCKHTNFELAVRSTLILSAPGVGKGGSRTDALVEFVDIYPTLCELAGLTLTPGLQGTSLVPLLRHPDQAWKKAAFSQWPKAIQGVGNGMGHSVRTERYRLTEWTVPEVEYSEVELYDYQADPHETVNLAKSAEHWEIVKELRGVLRAGWRRALPPGSPRGGRGRL